MDSLRDRLAALTPEQRARLEQSLGAPVPRAAPPPGVDDGTPFPMTDVQQAYWAGRGTGFALGGVATHSYTEIDAAGLDLDRLARAWNMLIARHPMLRAVFGADGTQRILAAVPPYVIATGDSAGLRARMSHQVLPADRWPLFDIHASRPDDGRTRLHLSFDALIADLSSRRLLMREWQALYRDLDATLPPQTTTFRAFAEATPDTEAARAYWLSRTLPPAPALPVQDHDPHTPPHFIRRTRRLARAPLEDAARAMGVTLNALLLTAYADVLRLWSDGAAFTLNLTLFNRPPAAAAVAGDFTTLTLLEVDAPGDASLGARAKHLQERLWRDLDHRGFGGVSVLREIARREGLPRAAMPVVFTSAIGESGDTSWLGDEVFSVSQTPQVWIDLMALSDGGDIVFHWNAVDALFPPDMMATMFAAFARHLDGTMPATAPWRDIAQALLPDDIRTAQRAANATAGRTPARLLHAAWKDHVRASPDHPAVIAPDRTLSYRELSNIVGHLARRLRAAPDTLVAVVMPKGWEQVAAVLAILESGAAYLPIDPETPPARLHYLLNDANVRIALTLPGLRIEGVECIAVTPDPAPAEPLEPVQGLAGLAYVIYTSGSSGVPKGVAIDHRGAVNTVEDINRRFAVTPSDRVLALSALSFDLSVYDIFGVLGAGGTIVMPRPDGARDPAHWFELIRRHGVTLWNSVPALMELLADYARGKGEGLPSLRLALLSGDTVPVSLAPAMQGAGIDAKPVSLGGATEASIWSILHPITGEDAARLRIPYGKPLRNQTMRVLAPGWVDCPAFVPGEIHIGGMGLARGYWNDRPKTDAAFVIDPATGARYYRTGDRGRTLPDGSIDFLGRADQQVKLNGFRIELGEIESVLAEHPAVAAAMALVQGGRTLIGYAVPRAPLSRDDLMRHLRERLPAHMLPSSIVLMAHFPLTPNGKVDRRALANLAVAPPAAPAPPAPHVAQIAALVRAASRADIPSDDSNFLDLGLNSVDLIRIINALDAALGFRPSIDALYAAPTIVWLASAYAGTPTPATTRTAPRALAPKAAMVRFGAQPLFTVHGSGGRTLFLHALARHLPSSGLYGVEAAETDGPGGSYLDAVRRVRPKGPYRLAGYSAGALIAADIAASLEAAGERVEALFLIDPIALPSTTPAPRAGRSEIAAMTGVAQDSPGFAYVEQVERDLAVFAAAYRRRPLACKIHVVHGTRGAYVPAHEALEAWRALATGGFEAEAIDCDHFEIVREPHAAGTGAVLRRWLEALA
jgi:amino acid adenylation domain-containing protein